MQRSVRVTLVAAAVALALPVPPAAASDNAPSFVVPGRVDVPVYIDGRNAAWSVVEGDWGLYRPGWVPPTVIRPLCCVPRASRRPVRHWYPAAVDYSVAEVRARLKRDWRPPKPGPAYHQSWEANSDDAPSTIMPPVYDVPDVLIAPSFRRW
ncbi:hypothetical protein A33M_1028 [Rhodovulum sp. PH10]|uniref:hypothetical protein n=1 Tax=Rhodovulum sp. PH10 TaxID=1187851 RepID=UPI00027C1EEE|nr:hypothetical protein [Rhodovulum sp. PH10]EJW09717.1 hypothetical protein A33M_1028 [Rhodovulum sp. PH10]